MSILEHSWDGGGYVSCRNMHQEKREATEAERGQIVLADHHKHVTHHLTVTYL